MKTRKHLFTRGEKLLLVTPLLCGLVAGSWWLSDQRSMAAPPTSTPKNLIVVPIDPQLSGDGRLIVAGIQLRDRIPVTDSQGNKDYFDELLGNEARFWNAQTLAPLSALPLLSTPGDLALSPDGSLLALSGSGDEFRVVDLQTRKTLWTQSDAASTQLEAPEPGMTVVLAPHGLSGPAFSPDSRTVAAWDTFIDAQSGRKQVTGFLFDARSGARIASWKVSSEAWISYMALRFSPDGRMLAATGPLVGLNYPTEIRDARDGKLLRTLPLQNARSAKIQAFGPNNRLLIIVDSSQYGSDVMEVDALTGQQLWSYTGTFAFEGQLLTIESAVYSADWKRIALGFRGSKSVVILDARNGKPLQSLEVSAAPNGPYAGDGAFAFSPDGRELWSMEQGAIRRQPLR